MILDSTENFTTRQASRESSIEAITIVIADDHPVVREGLVAIFKSQKDMKVIGEAIDGEETVELCNRYLPDVLLLDLRMPRKDGLHAITELTTLRLGKPRVIVMTTYERGGYPWCYEGRRQRIPGKRNATPANPGISSESGCWRRFGSAKHCGKAGRIDGSG